MTLGFGIIGCGTIANWHVAGIRAAKDAVLVGAADIKPAYSKAFCEKYNIRQFNSVQELLACPDIHIVSICTPSGLHASLAVDAARAGKHVLVEKPMALSVADADMVIEASRANDVRIGVVSQSRFTRCTKLLKAAIDEGRMGRIVTADVFMKYYRSQEYYDSSGWRGTWAMDGGGALMNQGIHGVDCLQYLIGPVKSVYGNARTLARNIEVEDTASAVLEFANGALGIIQGTTSVYPGLPRRLSVSGTRGTITINEEFISEWFVEGEESLAEHPSEDIASGASNPTNIETSGHELQVADIADAVRAGRPSLVDCREGKKPIQIITAIYESSRTGQRIDLNME